MLNAVTRRDAELKEKWIWRITAAGEIADERDHSSGGPHEIFKKSEGIDRGHNLEIGSSLACRGAGGIGQCDCRSTHPCENHPAAEFRERGRRALDQGECTFICSPAV